MLRLSIFGFLIFAVVGTASAGDGRPVPRQNGERCPSGTIGESDWCVPDNGTVVIESHGRRCPDGFVTDGNFCTKD